MSVNVERLSENSVKMTVEVSAEEFDQALDPEKCQKQSLFKDMVGVLYIKMLYNLYLKVLIQKQ